MIKQFYLIHGGDRGEIAVNRYSTLPKDSGQEPHHQVQFNAIPRKLVESGEGSYTSAKGKLAYSTVPAD